MHKPAFGVLADVDEILSHSKILFPEASCGIDIYHPTKTTFGAAYDYDQSPRSFTNTVYILSFRWIVLTVQSPSLIIRRGLAPVVMAEDHPSGVIHADPNEIGLYEIESLCMNCRDNVRMRQPSVLPLLIFLGYDQNPSDQDSLLQGYITRIVFM